MQALTDLLIGEAIAEKLKRYHDDGQLDSSEVLDVLAEVGVIEPVPGPAPAAFGDGAVASTSVMAVGIVAAARAD